MAALQMRRNQGNAMRCLFSSRMLRFFLDKTLQKRVLGTLAAFIIPCNPLGVTATSVHLCAAAKARRGFYGCRLFCEAFYEAGDGWKSGATTTKTCMIPKNRAISMDPVFLQHRWT